MDVAPLTYDRLSPTAVRSFEITNGSLLVELPTSRGRFLLSVLNRRDRLERALLTHQPISSLLWHHFAYAVGLIKLRLFHKRLLSIIEYISHIDMSYGWDTNENGNLVVLFVRLRATAP